MSDEKFTFDDFLIVPGYVSEYVPVYFSKATLFNKVLDVPIIASPMETITERRMMIALEEAGASSVHHRYTNLDRIEEALEHIDCGGVAISPSTGINTPICIASRFNNTYFVIDVAHGDSKKAYDYCKELRVEGITNIVSGNIATCAAAERYLKLGISHLRVGIGAGSRCTTRVVTGCGYPQGSAIHEIYQEFRDDVIIISDGGCKNTGDVIKAYSLGASFVMTGYLFSGTDECPNPKKYSGMASKDALEKRKKEFFVEGETTVPIFKGSAKKVVKEIKDAIQQACYYTGVPYYKKLVDAEKVRITQNTQIENNTR
jgi:IMP dehydrogenase